MAQPPAPTPPAALPLEAAREALRAWLPTPATEPAPECLPLREALGRVLAQDQASPIDVPGRDSAAMDGYALRGAELAQASGPGLALAGVGLAGRPHAGPVPAGACLRITTGAVLPEGLDTVLPLELARVEGGRVQAEAGALRPGAHVRRAGEDLRRGALALPAGRVLGAAELGLAASMGLASLPVRRRPRVAFLSTGDELCPLGTPLPEGGVYDSNRVTLQAMLQRLGVVEPLDFGSVRDEPQALEARFREAATAAEVVISTGGVSVGEADHTKAVMARLGRVDFWQLAMRPGRPMAIGRLPGGRDGQGALLFGLPGNPVAVMVTFYAVVRELLLALAGATPPALPTVWARSAGPIAKRPGRSEFPRGRLARSPEGRWTVALAGGQGAAMLRAMAEGDGLILLGHAQGEVAAGDWVEVLPFHGLA